MNKPGVAHKFFLSRKWPTSGHVSQQYEKQKQAWAQAHPEAASSEYEKAIREIAKRLNF
jgi:hypothetical protein